MPAGKAAGRYQHPVADRLSRVPGIQCRQAALLQILCQRDGGFFLTAGQHKAGHVAGKQIPQILRQQLDPPRPDRQLAGIDGIDRLGVDIPGRAGKCFQQNAPRRISSWLTCSAGRV